MSKSKRIVLCVIYTIVICAIAFSLGHIYAKYSFPEKQLIRSTKGNLTIRELINKNEQDKVISVNVEKNRAVLNLRVNVEFSKDVNMYDIGQKIQNLVKNSVEQTTGLAVDKVNVTINDVVMHEEASGKKTS